MSGLRKAIEDYIRMRRSLGFKLQQAEPALLGFASFLEQRDAAFVKGWVSTFPLSQNAGRVIIAKSATGKCLKFGVQSKIPKSAKWRLGQ